MNTTRVLFRNAAGLTGLAMLSACSGGGQSAAFVEACTASSNMDTEICKCMAGLAEEELSENGFAFLIASMQGDTEQASQLAGDLPVQEATAAGLFMVSAPAECAAQ